MALPLIASSLWAMRETGPPPRPPPPPDSAPPPTADTAATDAPAAMDADAKQEEEGGAAAAADEPPPSPPERVRAPSAVPSSAPPRSPSPPAAPPPMSPLADDGIPPEAPPSLRWYGGGAPPAPVLPTGAGGRVAACPGSGARAHVGCLSKADAKLAVDGAWYASPAARRVAESLAASAARGVVSAGVTSDGATSISFLLLRPAAVIAPESARGPTPAYDGNARSALARVLRAARHVLADGFAPLPDSRDPATDVTPLLLGGAMVGPDRDFDVSDAYVGVLYAGSAVVAAAAVRARGDVAELPLLAVRAEVRGGGLGACLLACVEHVLVKAGVKLVLAPALPLAASVLAPPGSVGPPPPPLVEGVPPLPPPRWWLSHYGYSLASAPQLGRAAAHPLLGVTGAALVAKELSAATAIPARAPRALELNQRVPAAAVMRARLLAPARHFAPRFAEARRVRQRTQSVAPEPAPAVGGEGTPMLVATGMEEG